MILLSFVPSIRIKSIHNGYTPNCFPPKFVKRVVNGIHANELIIASKLVLKLIKFSVPVGKKTIKQPIKEAKQPNF